MARRRTILQSLFLSCLVAGSLLRPAPATANDPAPRVRVETSMGNMVVELARDKAPKTVANFLAYVASGHYSGTVFHRVIPDFMIQGGGMTADLQQKATKSPIELESRNGLSNQRGTIAMARTGNPNSATSQFFINLKDNTMLDHPNPDGHGYAVFGKVVEGMEVVDKIAAVRTGASGMHRDVPEKAITIKAVTLLKP